MKRLVVLVCGGILLLSLCLAAFIRPSAHAIAIDLQCSGTQTVHFAPGLTNTPQKVKITSQSTLAPCLLPLGFLGGTSVRELSFISSCTSLNFPAHQATYQWNDETSSVVSYGTAAITRLVDGTTQYVGTGTVIDGLDRGDTVTETATYPNLNLGDCSSPSGLTSNTGSVVLVFTSAS